MEKIKAILIVLCLLILPFKEIAQPTFTNNYPDTLIRERLTNVIITEAITYVAGISFLSFIWYKDHERVPFHYYNDGKGYLQMDKAGHAFSAYHESYNAYYALRSAGVDKKRALIYGAPLGLVFQTPIEIFDGMYEGYGFSWWDMAANATGTIIFTIQEAFWNEQIVLMKFSYSPSGYPKYHDILGDNELQSFFLDYNGHTYWLSVNLKKITGIQGLPDWLNIAVGYSGNGMIKEFENPEYYQGIPFPELDRYRQYLFSLDIDLSRIHTNKKWLASILKHINIIKIPFPTLEINEVDGIKFSPLYF